LAHVLDAAQRKRADHTIELVGLKGESFAAKNPLDNLNPGLLNPSLRQTVHPSVRIDRRYLSNLSRVMRQIQARPETDFQNLAIGRGKQLTPVLRHEWPVEQKLAKTREDYFGVKAHVVLDDLSRLQEARFKATALAMLTPASSSPSILWGVGESSCEERQ